eukprot:3104046-Ditylum_brightwellii.AAC.1
MSNLPTDGITKETVLDSDCELIPTQMEVVNMRENFTIKDTPVLSELEWKDEILQYNIGDKVRFLGENSRDLVKIMGCDTIEGKMKYTVKFPNDYQTETTHEFLQPNLPDLAKILVTKEEYAA